MRPKFIFIFLLLWLIITLPCSAAEDESFPPLPEALEAMESDDEVIVTRKSLWYATENPDYYVLEPKQSQPSKGFIMYPGGKVDARSYAPSARALAAEGYLVVIVSMPFDLAHLGWRRANSILRYYDEIETWAIGGHSMGGAFACLFAKMYTWKIDGVILWATWPSALFRLDKKPLEAVSIYGTNDGYPEYIEDSLQHLPPGTELIKIEGGNHTQFGYYDTSPDPVQPHDNLADITREKQQEQIIEATLNFLEQL